MKIFVQGKGAEKTMFRVKIRSDFAAGSLETSAIVRGSYYNHQVAGRLNTGGCAPPRDVFKQISRTLANPPDP